MLVGCHLIAFGIALGTEIEIWNGVGCVIL
eukprot:SAG31_NODE_1578_length_7835_cov_6.998449_5_plen_30_part_00